MPVQFGTAFELRFNAPGHESQLRQLIKHYFGGPYVWHTGLGLQHHAQGDYFTALYKSKKTRDEQQNYVFWCMTGDGPKSFDWEIADKFRLIQQTLQKQVGDLLCPDFEQRTYDHAGQFEQYFPAGKWLSNTLGLTKVLFKPQTQMYYQSNLAGTKMTPIDLGASLSKAAKQPASAK